MLDLISSDKESFDLEIEYWKEKLLDVAPLNLGIDLTRSVTPGINKSSIEFLLEKELSEPLHGLSKKHDVSVFITLLSVFKILLYRYSNQEDICVGNIVTGKSSERPESFVNLVALRDNLNGEDKFPDLLERVNNTTLDAYNHLKTPFEIVVNNLIKKTDVVINPLFQVMFLLLDEAEVAQQETLSQQTAKYDLSFILTRELTGGVTVKITYTSGVYEKEAMERMGGHYKQLLQSVVASPGEKIGALPMLTAAEERELSAVFNDTEKAYPSEKTLQGLFEEQAAKTPGNIALRQQDKTMSYGELNAKANQLARYLVEQGVTPGDNVGLLVTRGFDMITGMYGIMKAGGAYVPIDPDYPLERQEYILQNSSVSKVLADDDYALTAALPEEQFIKISTLELGSYGTGDLGLTIDSKQLAYTIYTSGSTGRPKGVMIEHHSAVNLVNWVNTEFSVGEADRLLFITSMCFDLSVYDIFGILASGGSLVIVKQQELMDVPKLKEMLITYGITFWDSVPTTMEYLVRELEEQDKTYLQETLRIVFMSGDWIPVNLPNRIKQYFPNTRVISLGGATEGTVWSNFYPVEKVEADWSSIPYGRPMDNNFFYILNEQLQPVPVGVAGELYIGGVGVARGYANDEEKTAYSFVPDPFNDKLGGRMYRTGDLGRMLPGLNMEFIGRKANQVKIRGFRIELDEISSVLQKYKKVKDAIVIAEPINGKDMELIAYTTGGAKPAELRGYLKEHLPSYMIPGYYVNMKAFPLTSNGKVNRKMLPIPQSTGINGVEHIAPSSNIEKALSMIWGEVLGINPEQISIKADFFDMGGHSIKTIRLRGLIHKELGVTLPLKEIFAATTIEQQAKAIAGHETKNFNNIQVVAEQPDYPASSAQRRLWILHHFEGAQSAYNISVEILLEGDLDKEALRKSFKALLARHEILRTVFKEDENGSPRQKVINIADYAFSLEENNLSDVSGLDSKLKELVDKEINTGFNLSEGPLIRCQLIQLQENRHLLVIVLHHIISDGWSMDIFRKELSLLYNGYINGGSNQLNPLKIQYKDYSAWHTSQLESEGIAVHKEYWINQFQGELPVLELPAYKKRPAIKSYNGASLSYMLDIRDLDIINKSQGGTLFMSLLACLNTLFYHYTNHEDIIIGTPTAGREHPDLEDQIGFYINTLALRTRFSGNGSYEELYRHVKEVTLGAYDHQLYPYNELVEVLKTPRDVSRNPLFDVMIVLQNSGEQDGQYTLNGLRTKAYRDGEFRVAKFDISIIFTESKHGLHTELEYNTDIYSRAQVEQMLEHFKNIITSVAQDPKQKLSAIDFLTGEEKLQLLEGLNTTTVEYPKNKTIVELFEKQVKKTPKNTALIFEDKEISYQDLNGLANQFGNYLRQTYHIHPDDLVGILLDRSEWMIIAILGIIKSGAAYVPIDPEYPQERVDYIMRDSRCKVLVNAQELGKFIKLQDGYCPADNEIEVRPDNLIYCIYTSGSTGNPKGVLVEHRNLVNLVYTQKLFYNVTEDERILLLTNITFDPSAEQIWIAFLTGAALVAVSKTTLLDTKTMEAYIVDKKISHLASVPAYLAEININDKSNIKRVITGGENCPISLAERWKSDCMFINAYGPTETTVLSMEYCVKPGDNYDGFIPIGKPVGNTHIYIYNGVQHLLPYGVPGEICIGGDGVTRGYLNQPELTKEKFIENRYKPGTKIYRTGDLGRWLPDGNMEYLGRIDDQVKIRGFRIELGEIEAVLQQSDMISQAVVLAKAGTDGIKRLVGYVVGNDQYNREAVIGYLKSKLPDYMVPALWIEMEKLPLTSNEKIDKKALPDPDIEKQLKDKFAPPQTREEREFAEIWQEVLKLKSVGLDDNFFDLGGHSLLAVQIITKIENKTGKKLPLALLLKYPTIRSFNAFIKKDSEKGNWKSLVPIKPAGNKAPLYIVHGIGLNVLNFNNLALHVDIDQPLYGLQPKGLDGVEAPHDTIPDMAKYYINEIIQHNPIGPYAIAGYSGGGLIAFEIVRQLELLNKKVVMLGIFDLDADYGKYNWYTLNVKCYLPKFMGGTKSLYKELNEKVSRRTNKLRDKLGLIKNPKYNEFYVLLDKIKRKQLRAYENYKLIPQDTVIYLFRAEVCLHYNPDVKHLGWRKYSLKGVKEFAVPGDHTTMLLPPNVIEFAKILQNALDNAQ